MLSSSSVTAAAVALTAAAATLVSAQTDVSSSQFWHERYHGLLSMAAYNNDPTTVCAPTFDQAALQSSFPGSTEAPWQIINQFGPTASGASGFSVVVPEMDKIVVVFKGMFGWESTFNMSTANIGTLLNLGPNCANCTAHAGATQAYLEVREATNDFITEKEWVNTTGHQFSVTGHGFGGMLSLIMSIDQGWRGAVHWSHNHGAPRTFNPAAANLYNALFGGEAGQRTVANNDIVPTMIPESDDYTFTLQGFHIVGNGTSNSTYGYDYYVCNTENDPECLGGDSYEDHLGYYTPIGMCGKPYYGTNDTVELGYLSSASSAFYATATSTYTIPTPSTTSTTPSSSAMVTSRVASTGGAAGATTGAANAAAASGKAGSTSAALANVQGPLAAVGFASVFAVAMSLLA
ncbi:hypothetical protein BMF94_6691 [Rhodotorula taiwanensis]|uniref:Fungal lipase-type domain-containing protein n=1 Tax=Rhodotorula taiwanensis TaxID=741276 RepID=A0A2S5B0M6_9BASI|nr:hypothetical protein BMF94_6691 [Rhodotorula taiwanensis]